MSSYAPSPEQVRTALEELLGWTELVRSPQLAKFLSHIVEAKLRGDDASIKAYSIAVDVFGRPSSFDPQVDPIVRVQARRLRGLLQEFERQRLGRSGARITLPVGRYVPEFELVDSNSVAAPLVSVPDDRGLEETPSGDMISRPRKFSRVWPQAIAALSLVLGIGVLLAALQSLREPAQVVPTVDLPQPPTVYLSEVAVAGGVSSYRHLASKLGDQLSAVLAQSEDIEVGFVQAGKPMIDRAGTFLLTSTLTPSASATEFSFLLTDVSSGEQVWSSTQTRPPAETDEAAAASAIAAQVMLEIGSYRSALHAQGRAWLDSSPPKMSSVNRYVCVLAFRAARDTLSPSTSARASDCVDRLLQVAPEEPTGLAMKAWLAVQVTAMNPIQDAMTQKAMDDAAALAERAAQLAPDSGFVHELLAGVQGQRGDLQAAKRNYSIAIGFQPLEANARAGYALVLARLGEWTSAEENAFKAISASSRPSPWYYAVPALQAMREQRYADSIRFARLVAAVGPFGAVVAAAAAGLSRDQAVIDQYRPEVMHAEALRQAGIIAWLRGRISDPLLLVQLEAGLRAAGVPQTALTGPY